MPGRISCKDLGDNIFLISFNQALGLRKVVDNGPWMISKELLVVAEFDDSKCIDEFDFSSVSIWMRVERCPLCLMNHAVARAIGDDVGEFMEVEADGGDLAAGRALKAPRADGMTSLFYKSYWDIVGENITREVLHFLNSGEMPQSETNCGVSS